MMELTHRDGSDAVMWKHGQGEWQLVAVVDGHVFLGTAEELFTTAGRDFLEAVVYREFGVTLPPQAWETEAAS